MPRSGWPRPDKLNSGFVGFLSHIALFALVGAACLFYWSFACLFCFLILCFCGLLYFLFLLYYLFACLFEKKKGHGIE